MGLLRDLFRRIKGNAAGGAALIDGSLIPDEAPVLPLRNAVMFPGGVLPLSVGRPGTVALVDDAVARQALVLVSAQKDPGTVMPRPIDLYSVGTLCHIAKIERPKESERALVVHGLVRCRAVWFVRSEPYLEARIEALATENTAFDGVFESTERLRTLAFRLIERQPDLPKEAAQLVASIGVPEHLADLITANMEIPLSDKQRVLDTHNLQARFALVLELLARKLEENPPRLSIVKNDD